MKTSSRFVTRGRRVSKQENAKGPPCVCCTTRISSNGLHPGARRDGGVVVVFSLEEASDQGSGGGGDVIAVRRRFIDRSLLSTIDTRYSEAPPRKLSPHLKYRGISAPSRQHTTFPVMRLKPPGPYQVMFEHVRPNRGLSQLRGPHTCVPKDFEVKVAYQ